MAKKKANSGGRSAARQMPKKTNLPLILVAAVLVCGAAGTALFKSGGSGTNALDAPEIAAGEFLTIQTSEIDGAAAFFPVEIDGTAMEVLAVWASDGSVRTAFNTCQSCFTSGRGYYVQEGDDLVCQNCGFHFTPDQVEIQSGGCNPWPIFDGDKTVTEDTIQISYEFLRESSAIFANWKL